MSGVLNSAPQPFSITIGSGATTGTFTLSPTVNAANSVIFWNGSQNNNTSTDYNDSVMTEDSVIHGTGSGQPLGILNSPALVPL